MDAMLLGINLLCQTLCGLFGLHLGSLDRETQRRQFRRYKLAIIVTVVIGIGAAGWQQQRAGAASDRLLREVQQSNQALDAMSLGLGSDIEALIASGQAQPRLYGYVMYAYLWTYRGSPDDTDPGRFIDDRVPLRRRYEDVNRLDLGVYNNTGGIIIGTSIRAITPPGVSVTRGGCWTRPFWSYFGWGRVNRTYDCRISALPDSRGFHADYPLEFDFPTPGTYSVEYEISAPGQETVAGTLNLIARVTP